MICIVFFNHDVCIYFCFYITNTCEQPSKLGNTNICIRWTLVFRKRKKLRLAMGPFQIAIPHFDFNNFNTV